MTSSDKDTGGSHGPYRLGASVALCTFQGERYLPELLDSLERQTRPPDEMVVCDDGSTDHTVDILRDFTRRVQFPVRIHVNDTQLGSTKNFEKAIVLCRHDVIFLCDQDDIWHRDKTEELMTTLAVRAEAGAVFHNAELIDERSFSMGRSLWDVLGFGEERLRRLQHGGAMQILLEGNVVTGATLAFRARLRDLIVPIPQGWVQDYWIALLVAAVSEIGVLGEPLVRYRIHAGQQIGIPIPGGKPEGRLRLRSRLLRQRAQLGRRIRTNERALLADQARQFRTLHRRLEQAADAFPSWDGILEDLDGKALHLERRGAIPDLKHRWPIVRDELRSGRYHRYSSGLSAAAKDFLLLDRGAPPEELRDAWATTEIPTTIFLDIPETGGEAIRTLLRQAYGAAVFERPTLDLDSGREVVRALTAGELRRWATSARTANVALLRGISGGHLRRFRAVAGDFWFGVHELLLPQPSTYVTVVRDPVDRILSVYRQRVAHGLEMTLDRYLDEAVDYELHDGQTRRLAPPEAEGDDIRLAPCTEETLERAKAHLSRQFSVVGVSEYLDETVVLVKWALGLKGVRKIERDLPDNAAGRDDVSEDVIQRIEELNQHDLRLHAFARERLLALVERDAAAMEHELRQLRGRRGFRQGTSNVAERRRPIVG